MTTRPTYRLTCIGDLNLDLTVTSESTIVIGSDSPGKITMHGGGSAANVAAWAQRAGASARFIGAVGDDLAADFLTTELASHGVDVQPIRRLGTPSRTIAALVGPDGNRSLISNQHTTVAPCVDDYHDGWLDDTDWLHLTAYTYITPHSRSLFEHLTQQAIRRGIPLSIDPSAAEMLRVHCDREAVLGAFDGANVLFPSHDEAEYLTGTCDPARAATELLDLAHTVVVTCGPDGAHHVDRTNRYHHQPARATEVTNTLGCGDAFAGTYIAATLAGVDPRLATYRAAEAASNAATLPGGR